MTILNSIVRGFGNQLGRTAANKVLEKTSSPSQVVRVSPSLSFWQGIKTILWGFPMLLISLFLNTIIEVATNDINSPSSLPIGRTLLLALFFTLIIGYNYYKDNKRKLGYTK